MKSIYNKDHNLELIERINRLSPESQAQWGKMNAAQMLSHCQGPIDVAFGNLKLKPNFLIGLLGKMFKNKILNAAEFKKNSPTAPEFIRKEAIDFEQSKKELIQKVMLFSELGEKAIKSSKHLFFGEMSFEDWDRLQYMHLDHHLKQFGQ
ncbi:DUF1569 domain-containing protein [Flavobacterium acetivorans]|uniref:DUF1569 domain-containing protein n=1 Tax=Flavobacterium acetivorans TaxID=2893883 RepID=UPI001E363DC8|nr:DUF1569 domain-containing protein [Flavobacterium sp. F-29]UFH34025.1 DUF1569 domain-containing protein [Flavobacterium sp. F-29]